ncbi:SDR family NAD(P)-dependent oxidoreductase [Pseudomonas alkylphenolica]|uniref:Short chain dehydrogenase/reductase family oxidoreductase n=1 Tax=Pseudomonas alkylphenolica TaxID=237609 RepID=A0A077FEQ2_9PSED|nr:SDR family NAD(P)-dependent oxidoreductase [Pseudomonas alkylphenolica]AIL63713.1 short chain dehydrogenase/reductase family oxidoreductase [Pseudomonas alkylphenolica]
MNNSITNRVWVTGASSGLGLALVEQLLEQGSRVAASGRACELLQDLSRQYPESLLLLDGNLSEPYAAQEAARQITDHWGALDCLILNAGTCDYLAIDTPAPAIFEGIVSSNLSATRHCLESAWPLLQHDNPPQVVGILSRYSVLQLDDPGQPATVDNSLIQLLNSQRAALAAQAIDLTIIAPLDLKFAQVSEQVAPEQWTAHTAAEVILDRLPDRPANLVLEALHLNDLWPLPR